MNLPPLIQSFVLLSGEMGSSWGINRSVGQIYALLCLSEAPLCADEIVEALGISRSNVSIGLRELQARNLILLSHKPGDRRDFYTTPGDVWQILRTLAEEPKKREIDPAVMPVGNRASWLLAVAPLVWIPQAALLAHAMARIVEGGGTAVVAGPAAGVFAPAAAIPSRASTWRCS